MDFGDIICTVFAIIASCFVAFFALDAGTSAALLR